MSTSLLWLLFGSFFAGYILQTSKYLQSRDDIKAVIIFIFIALIGFVPGKSEQPYQYGIQSHMVYYFCLLSLFIFVFFQKRILPPVNELSILVYTIIIWYFLLNHSVNYILMAFMFFPTCVAIIAAMYPLPFSKEIQVVFYILFLFESLILMWLQITRGSLAISFQLDPNASPISYFFSGMVFFTLAMRVISIWLLIPVPSKHQTWANRMKEYREYIHLFPEKYSDQQLRPVIAVCIVALLIATLILNYQFRFVSEEFLLDGIFIGLPLFIKL